MAKCVCLCVFMCFIQYKTPDLPCRRMSNIVLMLDSLFGLILYSEIDFRFIKIRYEYSDDGVLYFERISTTKTEKSNKSFLQV